METRNYMTELHEIHSQLQAQISDLFKELEFIEDDFQKGFVQGKIVSLTLCSNIIMQMRESYVGK
jgi:hypothetical protein